MPLTEALMLVESPPTRHGLRSMAGLFFFVFFCFCFCFFLFQSGICFRCRLDNPRRFPNFQLPTIGVTADFYIRHFLDNRRCSYTINVVQRKHNFCCKWTCLYTYIQGLARSQTSWVLQSTLALSICSHFSIHTLKMT
jgi:hypothetical protein